MDQFGWHDENHADQRWRGIVGQMEPSQECGCIRETSEIVEMHGASAFAASLDCNRIHHGIRDITEVHPARRFTNPTLNARVSAWCLVASSILILIASLQSQSLAPLRLVMCATATTGIWAFCDEMGMRKPLVRAGFVVFVLAMIARSTAIIEPDSASVGHYYLVYAFAMLGSLLLWSVAYLHRQADLKIVGAVGVLASLAPLVALVAGHLAVGTGAALGVGALLGVTTGSGMSDFSAINTIDRLFILWSCVTAWLLLIGRIGAGRRPVPCTK